MLIRSLRAENFMRFSALTIRGIPQRGVIGIEGLNESGKTTIGDAILFALFGKTPKNEDMPVSELIRWNADKLFVELEFSVPGAGDFLVYREIDRHGVNFVKLLESASRREVAIGNVDVNRTLSRLLRFDPREFQGTFYLGQHVAVSGNGFAPELLDSITGNARIREAIGDIETQLEQLEREYTHYSRDIQKNEQQIGAYQEGFDSLERLVYRLRQIDSDVETKEVQTKRVRRELGVLRNFGRELSARASRLEGARGVSLDTIAGALEGLSEKYRSMAGQRPVRDDREDGEGGEQEQEKESGWRYSGSGAFRSGMESCERLCAAARAFVALRATLREHAKELTSRLSPERSDGWPARQRRAEETLRGRERTCSRLSLWTAVALLVALVSGVVTALVFAGILQVGFLREALVGAGVQSDRVPDVLGIISGALVAVVALCVLVGSVVRMRRRAAQNELENAGKALHLFRGVAERLDAALFLEGPGEIEAIVKAAASIEDGDVRERWKRITDRFSTFVDADGEEHFRSNVHGLAVSQKKLAEKAKKDAQAGESGLKDHAAESKRKLSERNRLGSEIREIEASRAEKDTLVQKNNELEGRARALNDEIDVRRVAVKLLEETARSVRGSIGPAVSRFVRDILPRLTDNRYRDVKVDSDFGIHVFATDKNDFMNIAELSGGTLESLKLALRLAASQTLVESRMVEGQFVFLDEPFKMVDCRRAGTILETLKQLSSGIRQIFIVQPAFSQEQRRVFDLRIWTDVGSSKLEVESDTILQS